MTRTYVLYRMTRNENAPTDMTYDQTSYDIRIPWRMTLRMAWYGQKDWGTYDVAYALNRMP